MIKILVSALYLFAFGLYGQTSFAVLPMGLATDVTTTDRESYESKLYQKLIGAGRYRVVDRNQIQQVLKEQNLQMSDLSDQKKVIEFGKLAGAEKIFSGKLFKKSTTQPAVSFSVIDISTGQIEFSDEVTYDNYSFADIAAFTVSRIIVNYPMIGSVLGRSGDIFVINIGQNNNIQTGDRVFVARKDVLKDDTGEVLMEETKRIGLLTITLADKSRSQCKIERLENPSDVVRKGDMVSPDPIPEKPASVSPKPLLPNVKKGALLLDDNMESQKYLTATYNSGDSYKSGRFFLNATTILSGHAYCYYPAPWNALSDYIMEGEVTMEKTDETYNKLNIVWRSNGNYGNDNSYFLYVNNDGGYSVSMFRSGMIYDMVNYQAAAMWKRGQATNKFRIVLSGTKMDIYFNDQFVTGFEDEHFWRGLIGFYAAHGGHISIDNVKIWEVAK